MIVLHLFLTYTMMGKALRACAINRAAAGLVGIRRQGDGTDQLSSLAAAFGALGGVVVAPSDHDSLTVWES